MYPSLMIINIWMHNLKKKYFNEAEDTLTSLYKFVDGMNTEVDKKKLNQLFANLYNEAQNLEV
jgi:hypothetical protein